MSINLGQKMRVLVVVVLKCFGIPFILGCLCVCECVCLCACVLNLQGLVKRVFVGKVVTDQIKKVADEDNNLHSKKSNPKNESEGWEKRRLKYESAEELMFKDFVCVAH
jgi:hypothetical protein